MKWEQLAFPAMIAAAVLTIWYIFRNVQPPTVSQVAAAGGLNAIGVAALPVQQLPPETALAHYMSLAPATRFNPPSELRPPMLSGLKYPSDLTNSMVGVGPDGTIGSEANPTGNSSGAGCCCGG